MNQTEQHLKIIAIFHYVLAAITALFSLFPLIHLAIGFMMVSDGFEEQSPDFPTAFAWLFMILPGVMILAGMALAICIAISGRKITKRQSHTFSLVIAGLSCMFMPFGTILGIFTIIILLKPEVKELYNLETTT